MKAVLWCGAAGLSLACYSYVPMSLDAVPAGTTVRALLSTEAQLALRDSLGFRQQVVQGTLVDREGDRVLLAVRTDGGDGSWGGGGGGGGSHVLYQRVAIAPRDLLQVEVKRFHRGRTAALVLGIAAATTVAVIEAVRRGNPGASGPPGGGPREQVVPW